MRHLLECHFQSGAAVKGYGEIEDKDREGSGRGDDMWWGTGLSFAGLGRIVFIIEQGLQLSGIGKSGVVKPPAYNPASMNWTVS
jgi:hypothetical protein